MGSRETGIAQDESSLRGTALKVLLFTARAFLASTILRDEVSFFVVRLVTLKTVVFLLTPTPWL